MKIDRLPTVKGMVLPTKHKIHLSSKFHESAERLEDTNIYNAAMVLSSRIEGMLLKAGVDMDKDKLKGLAILRIADNQKDKRAVTQSFSLYKGKIKLNRLNYNILMDELQNPKYIAKKYLIEDVTLEDINNAYLKDLKQIAHSSLIEYDCLLLTRGGIVNKKVTYKKESE